MNFSPFQPNFLDYLRDGNPDHLKIGRTPDGEELHDGNDWFREAVAYTFRTVAYNFGYKAQFSKKRTREARSLWIADIKNMKIDGGGEPDHFKQAGFLAYWMRRRIPISLLEKTDRFDGSTPQLEFADYPNEICSFVFGLRVCIFFEAPKRETDARLKDLEALKLSPAFLRDIAVLLFHKQVSPHAMYLIYRSLFYNLGLHNDETNVTHFARPTLVK